MAEGDGYLYNVFKWRILNGTYNLANGGDTLKLALVTSGYSPDIDADDQWADVSANEESGTGYTAGGETLANQATSQDDANDRGKFDADDVTWTGLDVGTPAYAVLYSTTATYLIAYFEVATASNGGNYTISWHTNGIILLT